MQNKHEVLTMEQLHHLINIACNVADVSHKTKVKLKKIIKNEEFEFEDLDGIFVQVDVNSDFFDLTKAVYMRWLDYFKKSVNGVRDACKLKQTKNLEDAHLMVDIECNENNYDDEKRSSLHDFLEYKFKKHLSLFTIDLLENPKFFELVEAEFLADYNEHREYTTIEGYLNGYSDRLFSFTENFCSINKVGLDVMVKLLKVAKVHHLLTLTIIADCNKRLIEGSNYLEIVDSFKSHYEEEMKVKPREKGFRFYLEGVFEIHNLHSDDILMRHLAEYVISEKKKNADFIQEAKDKQQALIDITPQQTLSIETTFAHVEEGEKDKSYPFTALQIAIAVTMVNEKTGQFSKTDSKIKGKFVEDIEKGFKFKNVPKRFFREYASLQLSKEYLQNLGEQDKEEVKRILELGGYKALLKDIK